MIVGTNDIDVVGHSGFLDGFRDEVKLAIVRAIAVIDGQPWAVDGDVGGERCIDRLCRC